MKMVDYRRQRTVTVKAAEVMMALKLQKTLDHMCFLYKWIAAGSSHSWKADYFTLFDSSSIVTFMLLLLHPTVDLIMVFTHKSPDKAEFILPENSSSSVMLMAVERERDC